MKIDETNFYHCTKVTFQPCDMPSRACDYESESGSRYWFERDGVVRASDHYGNVASCLWFLEGGHCDGVAAGFASFSSFELTPAAARSELERSWHDELPGRVTTFVHAPKNINGSITRRVVDLHVIRLTGSFVVAAEGRFAKHTLFHFGTYPRVIRASEKKVWFSDGKTSLKFSGWERLSA